MLTHDPKTWKTISLDGVWRLFLAPQAELVEKGLVARRDRDLNAPTLKDTAALTAAGIEEIPGRVPGNFELDLVREGKCPDPFFGKNTLDIQKFETYHVFYARTFTVDAADLDGETEPELYFEGIDTVADIYLNGERIGSVDNMFIPHRLPVDTLRAGENELLLHVKPATLWARRYTLPSYAGTQPYNYEMLYVRKPASAYGWDIMPRTVSAGIWRPVSLRFLPADRVEDVHIFTLEAHPESNTARIRVLFHTQLAGYDPKEYSVRLTGVCGDSRFEGGIGRLFHTEGRFEFHIDNAKLWMPAGYGEPNLYDVRFELLRNGKVVDTYTTRVGLRRVELVRTSTAPTPEEGAFYFKINGQKVFCLGSNWVPLDAFHSRDAERLPAALAMLKDIGCNMVRCWGGNVYEDEAFFDFCDENGIMVWQDFAMACGAYPRDEDFCRRLGDEVVTIVRKLRNHVSLTLWSGDNECDYSVDRRFEDPNGNYLTRKLIPELLKMHDFTRPFLPSSPYFDEEAFKTGKPTSEDHLWGPRDYFKGSFYGKATAKFASETGYHGCPSPASLARFLSPDALKGWRAKPGSDRPNDEWLVHAACMELGDSCYSYRIGLEASQVRTLFGKEPEALADFALASQISQAEAMKYFIERFRLARDLTGGIIWWNLIDGWPQISDAVVDYYGTKKLAYSYIKRAQEPAFIAFREPQDGIVVPGAVNDLDRPIELSWRVTNRTTGAVAATGKTVAAPRTVTNLPVALTVAEGEHTFYAVEWEADGVRGSNHWMSNLIDVDFETYVGYLRGMGYLAALEGF